MRGRWLEELEFGGTGINGRGAILCETLSIEHVYDSQWSFRKELSGWIVRKSVSNSFFFLELNKASQIYSGC